jgi:hypothetical protein
MTACPRLCIGRRASVEYDFDAKKGPLGRRGSVSRGSLGGDRTSLDGARSFGELPRVSSSQVRDAPSWLRSWANFSPAIACLRRNAEPTCIFWANLPTCICQLANLRLLGRPDTLACSPRQGEEAFEGASGTRGRSDIGVTIKLGRGERRAPLAPPRRATRLAHSRCRLAPHGSPTRIAALCHTARPLYARLAKIVSTPFSEAASAAETPRQVQAHQGRAARAAIGVKVIK